MMKMSENRALVALAAASSIAFAWVLYPFLGVIIWAAVIAVLAHPLNLRLRKAMKNRGRLAAVATVAIVTIAVIIPLLVVCASLGAQASQVYKMVQSGELDFASYAQRVEAALPSWVREVLNYLNLGDLASLKGKLKAGSAQISQAVAARALGLGLGALDFVVGLCLMLYLLFFLLCDGEKLLAYVRGSIPLNDAHKTELFKRVSLTIRATVKGGVSVAAIQGLLGGLAFWVLGISAPLLWAVVMAFLSLLPAIGAGIVWAPVAIYLIATGSLGAGLLLIGYGVVVIGLVDNLLRPFLVGKSTKLPDYIVLLSTLGGIQMFGLTGFVVGPLIAAIFLVSWEIMRRENRESAPSSE